MNTLMTFLMRGRLAYRNDEMGGGTDKMTVLRGFAYLDEFKSYEKTTHLTCTLA